MHDWKGDRVHEDKARLAPTVGREKKGQTGDRTSDSLNLVRGAISIPVGLAYSSTKST